MISSTSQYIDGLRLANRIVLPPMASQKAVNGEVTDELIAHYQNYIHSGVGLVIVEHSYVNREGRASEHMLNACPDNKDALKQLAGALEGESIPVAMQLNHAGAATTKELTGGRVLSPSGVRSRRSDACAKPEVMTEEDIQTVIRAFTDAAVCVKEAGFQIIEIHSAHGYLLDQFYSPLTNKRQDHYGGSLENRIRIHVEIIRAIKQAVGETFPLMIRLGGSDYTEGGATIEDAVRAAVIFEKEGVHAIDLSGGLCGYQNPGNTYAYGYFQDMSCAVTEAVEIPVMLTGGITTIAQAETLLAERCCDLVGVGRALLENVDWLKDQPQYHRAG